ncbi:MAG: ribose 5-phosphate isomerase B [Bacillota bacterium]
MRVAIGSDHAGYKLKELIKVYLQENGIDHHDFGAFSEESVDYPDFALPVAEAVARCSCDRGILVCGTGIGVAITANKVPGIRAALCSDTFSARSSREHNDANILTLGERVLGPGLVVDIVKVWLETEFAGGRHSCRVEKIRQIESKYINDRGGDPHGCK